jgi:hypothetical protein
MSNITVNEGAGQAVFTVNVSVPAGVGISVSYLTGDGTAVAGQDYQAVNTTVNVPAGAASFQLTVPLIDDNIAEPNQTFVVNLYNPVNATLGSTGAWATIVDNERPRAPIDTNLPGAYFADGTALPGYDDYLLIGNRWAQPITARLTYTRSDGSGTTHDVVVPASSRITVHLPDEPGVAGEEVSMAVQSTDTAHPLDADHSVYWGPNWQSGRSTEGVSPSQVWYFAEGSTGYFDEYLTFFNPSSTPVDVWMGFYGTNNGFFSQWVHIEPGPGRTKIHVNPLFPATDFGTRIWASVPIVVERTMTWALGADQNTQVEGHSSPGSPVGSNTWYFAEGDTGFATFLALLNLDNATSSVHIEYLHANGTAYPVDVTIPPYSRATVSPPGWLPLGSFGYRITANTQLVAERSMYGGTNWTLGTNGVGATTPRALWYFSEGSTGSFWDTYILLSNPSTTTTANVWLAFIRDDGQLFWQFVAVAPNQRQSVLVDTVPGVTAAIFRTEVRSDQPVMAERTTYWPGSSQSAAFAAMMSTAPTGEAGVVSSEPSLGFNPYTTRRPRAPANLDLYHVVTQGDPASDTARALAAAPADDGTTKTKGGTIKTLSTSPTGATTNDVGSSGWYGAHLTGGRP